MFKYPSYILISTTNKPSKPLMRHFILWHRIIKKKLFEEQTFVEPVNPRFSKLFVTFLCAATRKALPFLLEFHRLLKVGAIRGNTKTRGQKSKHLFHS